MTDKWTDRFLSLATEVATWSKDPSTQCGCVLVSPDRRTIILGYNGFPRWMDDDESLYDNRTEKYKRVLHAEENAVLNAGCDLTDFTAYVTAPPCTHCALVLIQSGVVRVVYRSPTDEMYVRWADSINTASCFFYEAGVEVDEVRYDA